MMKSISIRIISIFVIILINVNSLYSQSHDDNQHSNHDFKHFRASVNIGHGYTPAAKTINSTNVLIIPVYGFDMQYWFNSKWGIGFKGDLELTDYLVESEVDNTKIIIRENPLILSIPVFYMPFENVNMGLMIGPGMELEKHENFFVMRFGVAYDFELGKHWDVAPEIIYDFKNGHINSFTFAISFGKRF